MSEPTPLFFYLNNAPDFYQYPTSKSCFYFDYTDFNQDATLLLEEARVKPILYGYYSDLHVKSNTIYGNRPTRFKFLTPEKQVVWVTCVTFDYDAPFYKWPDKKYVGIVDQYLGDD